MAEEIIASSPGDIVIVLKTNAGTPIIPIKTLTWQETNGVTQEYGIGNHEPYAQVQGKKSYKLDFSIGSWWVSAADNPATWENLMNTHLIYADDQRLSREFDVIINGREGGDYTSQASGPLKSAAGTIDVFRRCILNDSGGDIPEVSGTVTRKYSATCFTIKSASGG